MGTTNDPDGMLFANPLAMLLLSGLDQDCVAVLAGAFASPLFSHSSLILR